MNLGSLFTSIGESGSQAAEAKLKTDQFKLDQLFNQLNLKQGQAQLEETQARTKKMGAPLPTETDKMKQSVDAFKSVFHRDPTEAELRVIFGLGPDTKTPVPVTSQVDAGLQALPEDKRKLVEPIIRGYMANGEQDKALKALETFAEKVQPESTEMKLVSPVGGGAPSSLQVGNKTFTPGDPGWTPKMQAFYEAGVKSHQEFLAHKEKEQDRQWGRRLALSEKLTKGRDSEKLLGDYDKATKTMKQWTHMENIGDNAENYMNNPTGPGDVALMLAYVEAVRPTSGFRFTDAERQMILGTRGIVDAAKAKYEQGARGVLFGDKGSDQRKEIANIVSNAADDARKQKDDYLNGIQKMKPDLYNILTDNNDDLEPVQ